MWAGMLVGAGGAVLTAALLARRSPLLLACVVALVGGLHAQGVLAVPTPTFATAAAARVHAVQERSTAALSCRQAVLRAADADDPVLAAAC